MSYDFEVQLIYCFEKSGVLMNEHDENSKINEINPEIFGELKASGVVSGGMIPKLSDGFAALNRGVAVVVITNPAGISEGLRGTRLVLE
jgi:acetylglutamate kinase